MQMVMKGVMMMMMIMIMMIMMMIIEILINKPVILTVELMANGAAMFVRALAGFSSGRSWVRIPSQVKSMAYTIYSCRHLAGCSILIE